MIARNWKRGLEDREKEDEKKRRRRMYVCVCMCVCVCDYAAQRDSSAEKHGSIGSHLERGVVPVFLVTPEIVPLFSKDLAAILGQGLGTVLAW